MSKRIKEIIVRYDDKQSFIYGNTLGEVVGELVRCKECKYWRNTDAEKIPTASIACGNMHADDFCSYGEREGE